MNLFSIFISFLPVDCIAGVPREVGSTTTPFNQVVQSAINSIWLIFVKPRRSQVARGSIPVQKEQISTISSA